jgi:hypothetical protein
MDNEWKCPFKTEDIPAYLNWVAQDMDGIWCGFKFEPVADSNFCAWLDVDAVFLPGGEYLATGEFNANWRNTKQRIPR